MMMFQFFYNLLLFIVLVLSTLYYYVAFADTTNHDVPTSTVDTTTTTTTTSFSSSISISSSSSIPVIDISPWTMTKRNTIDNSGSTITNEQKSIANKISIACTDIGFFVITGHNVNATIIDAALKASAEFFDLPISTKLLYKTHNESEYPYGYEHSERLQLGRRKKSEIIDARDDNSINNNNNNNNDDEIIPPPADLKETFSIGPYNPLSGMTPRRFPSKQVVPDFQTALEEYYIAMEELSLTILTIFAVALDLPSIHWFDDKMDKHLGALRTLNYFPIQRSLIPNGAIRASAHSDYGALTILRSGGPGLQVQQPILPYEWIDIPYVPDAFIINIGDLMQRWTNDKWVSTMHRVVIPPPSSITTTEAAVDNDDVIGRRQSIAYFCNINGDTIVEPIVSSSNNNENENSIQKQKYPPIKAKDYLLAKHLASMSTTDDDDNDNGNDEL